ncbi:VirB3 family type IV secretion system protein [Candidatus Bandiella euplotis]|uniref:Type IV secretion system protein VirB3 n=1 Tax=Candidatus Bandiella euplotis TaxID=1664265 RepID=A0ABZ0UR92_9RICK|nr:VirB3 family type IV secretion system protein [Candidatus Bandiella woodruffii]WPX97243.1 Type IV secretion system protein VirB3 [Candidatus Bandiella woodruffii]
MIFFEFMPGSLNTDHLFVGLTRPTLLFGASYNFFIINAFVCMISYIMTANFLYLAISFPIHGLGVAICYKEPLFIGHRQVKKVEVQKVLREEGKNSKLEQNKK